MVDEEKEEVVLDSCPKIIVDMTFKSATLR